MGKQPRLKIAARSWLALGMLATLEACAGTPAWRSDMQANAEKSCKNARECHAQYQSVRAGYNAHCRMGGDGGYSECDRSLDNLLHAFLAFDTAVKRETPDDCWAPASQPQCFALYTLYKGVLDDAVKDGGNVLPEWRLHQAQICPAACQEIAKQDASPVHAASDENTALAQQVETQCATHCEEEAVACMRFTRSAFGAVNPECNWASRKKSCMDECRPKLMAASRDQSAQPTSAPPVDVEATLDAFDADVMTADQLIALLERTKAPWPEPVIARVKPIGETLGRLASTSRVLATTAIPKSLEARALASAGKATRVVARGNALEPSVKKTVAFYQARRNARTAALLQTMFSGGGGASSSTSTDDRVREVAARREGERTDDERKRQDDASSRRNNCVSQCQNELSGCMIQDSRQFDDCARPCRDNVCRDRCVEESKPRQHSCHERYDETPCRSRCN